MNMANLGAGAMGAASGAMSGASMGPIGMAAGGILGGLGGLFGGEDEVEMPSAEDIARDTVAAQGIKTQGLLDLRAKHDPRMSQLAMDQMGRTQAGLRPFQQQVISNIAQDRRTLSDDSIGQFREQAKGFAGAERLQAILQQQAEDELRRGGRLSAQEARLVEQGTQGATQRQGRGSGAFNVGQLAVNRAGAMNQREAQGRQFAMGVQTQGLNLSNPLSRIFAQDAGTIGSSLDNLRNQQQFAQQSQVQDFDPFGGQGVSQFNTGMQSGFNQRSSDFTSDIIGGGISSLNNLSGLGGMFGGGGGGIGGVGGGSFSGAGDIGSGQHGPLMQGGTFF